MSESSQYIDEKIVNESYRPKSGLMSPGLKRAREPFRVRNALTGLALGAFAVGIWAYSISAVKQDVFDDVDEEARAMVRSGGAAGVQSLEDEKKATQFAAGTTTVPGEAAISKPALQQLPPSRTSSRGLSWYLDAAFPRLLDPQQKTLVWGAPPVDNIGKM